MERALHLFNELCDVVEANPRLHLAKVPGRNLEGFPVCRAALACQPATQRFVYDFSERAAGAARFRFELGRYIVIQS